MDASSQQVTVGQRPSGGPPSASRPNHVTKLPKGGYITYTEQRPQSGTSERIGPLRQMARRQYKQRNILEGIAERKKVPDNI